jgi:hypothetical protein
MDLASTSPGSDHKPRTSRQHRVIAFAAAHRDWIATNGRLPTHDEASALRATFRIGETSAAEWEVIREIVSPRDPRPAASYRAVCRNRVWAIIGGDGNDVPIPERCSTPAWTRRATFTSYNGRHKLKWHDSAQIVRLRNCADRMATWAHIAKLREEAGIKTPIPISPFVSVIPPATPCSNPRSRPRTMRGH